MKSHIYIIEYKYLKNRYSRLEIQDLYYKVLGILVIFYSKSRYDTDDLSVKARKFLYKERSNIFAYYIIKMVLLWNCDEFIQWCEQNNKNIIAFTKTEKNLSKFYNFIEKYYNAPEMIEGLDKMQILLKKSKKLVNIKEVVPKTLRMTVIEIG